MSERLGPVAYRTSEEHPFLGKEFHEQREFSEHTAQLIDEEVARILHAAAAPGQRLVGTEPRPAPQAGRRPGTAGSARRARNRGADRTVDQSTRPVERPGVGRRRACAVPTIRISSPSRPAATRAGFELRAPSALRLCGCGCNALLRCWQAFPSQKGSIAERPLAEDAVIGPVVSALPPPLAFARRPLRCHDRIPGRKSLLSPGRYRR